jgi:hypothetical protein
MISLCQAAAGAPGRTHGHGHAGLPEAIIKGLLQALADVAVLLWAKRSGRPCLPQPQARLRSRCCLVRHRWQAMFPALPRPGPRPGAVTARRAAGQVTR